MVRAFLRLQCDAVRCRLHFRDVAEPITPVELQQNGSTVEQRVRNSERWVLSLRDSGT